MTITASGGAFRDTPLDKIASMGPSDALKHPNWSMGSKITIDSATMTNKLFELLEAKWLLVCKSRCYHRAKVIIHAFVDFVDDTRPAHLANADNRLPIAYALLGRVEEAILPPVNLHRSSGFTFKKFVKNAILSGKLKTLNA